MKNLNEQIAEKMGWHIDPNGFIYVCGFDRREAAIRNIYINETPFENTPTGHWLSHLLVGKMVGDGWEIKIDIWKEKNGVKLYDPMAIKDETWIEFEKAFSDAPAAIVALFCKVYKLEAK